jgi:hypothetical protein
MHRKNFVISATLVALRRSIHRAPITGRFGPVRGRLARAPELVRRLKLELESQPARSLTLHDVAYILDLDPSFCSDVFPSFVGECFCKWIRGIALKRQSGCFAIPRCQ